MQRTGTSESISTVVVAIGATGDDRSKFIDFSVARGDDGLMSRCLTNRNPGFAAYCR